MSTTIMTGSAAPVTAGDEPEPQHERDTSNPDTLPPLPRRNRVVIRNNDACPLCGFWRCRCAGFVPTTAATDSDPDMDEALRRVRTGR